MTVSSLSGAATPPQPPQQDSAFRQAFQQLTSAIGSGDLKDAHKSGAHVGIGNINHRMRTVFGEDYALMVETAPDAGMKVTMRVPKFSPGVRPVLAVVPDDPADDPGPDDRRVKLAMKYLGPVGSWWLRPRVEGKVPVMANTELVSATDAGNGEVR